MVVVARTVSFGFQESMIIPLNSVQSIGPPLQPERPPSDGILRHTGEPLERFAPEQRGGSSVEHYTAC